jgi:hypothetical protein
LKGYRTLFPKLKLNRIKWLMMFIFGGYLVRLVFSIVPVIINHFVFNLDYRILSILYSCDLVFQYCWLFVCLMYDNIQCAYLTYKVFNFKKKLGVLNLSKEFKTFQIMSFCLVLLDWLAVGLAFYLIHSGIMDLMHHRTSNMHYGPYAPSDI